MATLTMSDGGGIVPGGPFFKTQLPGERAEKERSDSAFLLVLAVHFGALKTASEVTCGLLGMHFSGSCHSLSLGCCLLRFNQQEKRGKPLYHLQRRQQQDPPVWQPDSVRVNRLGVGAELTECKSSSRGLGKRHSCSGAEKPRQSFLG